MDTFFSVSISKTSQKYIVILLFYIIIIIYYTINKFNVQTVAASLKKSSGFIPYKVISHFLVFLKFVVVLYNILESGKKHFRKLVEIISIIQ